jgi:tyrosinase
MVCLFCRSLFSNLHVQKAVPNKYIDPVFFLHHTQLDRLWWMWQQADYALRVEKISGKRIDNATDVETSNTALNISVFGPAIKAHETLDTKKKLFCYEY